MEKLLQLIYDDNLDNWTGRCSEAFDELYTSQNARYPEKARKVITLRAPAFSLESGVSFAALIHPSNPDSGAYGGMSFVIFPINNGPCLISFVIWTQGLSPDEEVIGRPGHSRKVQAICNMLNSEFGEGNMIAWAKQDPTRTDLDIPLNIKQLFNEYQNVFEKYGKVIYGIFKPTENRDGTEIALKSFIDLMFDERGIIPRAGSKQDYEEIRSKYFNHLFPVVKKEDVISLLKNRKFVILEGPPGTGKTRMAMQILQNHYESNGVTIQFHPNTTYENFIGGLFPEKDSGDLGFHFIPKRGDLIDAVSNALKMPNQPFLLNIDEINRADLSKVLVNEGRFSKNNFYFR